MGIAGTMTDLPVSIQVVTDIPDFSKPAGLVVSLIWARKDGIYLKSIVRGEQMDIRVMKHFYTIVEEENISNAAQGILGGLCFCRYQSKR